MRYLTACSRQRPQLLSRAARAFIHQPRDRILGVHVQREPLVTVSVMLRLAVRDALTRVRGLLGLIGGIGHAISVALG